MTQEITQLRLRVTTAEQQILKYVEQARQTKQELATTVRERDDAVCKLTLFTEHVKTVQQETADARKRELN